MHTETQKDTQTYTETQKDTQKDTETQKDTQTYTETHKDIQTQKYTPTHKDTWKIHKDTSTVYTCSERDLDEKLAPKCNKRCRFLP